MLPRLEGSPRACWRSEVKNQRSGGCQKGGNLNLLGVLPRAATAGPSGDQEGKGGGGNSFIWRGGGEGERS
jgi:hypothetical protein